MLQMNMPGVKTHNRGWTCLLPVNSLLWDTSCAQHGAQELPAWQVWAVKSYTKGVPLYVQVLQRASLQLISPFLDPARDVIISMEQTRHRLLALSCLCPGASTLLGAHAACREPPGPALMLHVLCSTPRPALQTPTQEARPGRQGRRC